MAYVEASQVLRIAEAGISPSEYADLDPYLADGILDLLRARDVAQEQAAREAAHG